MMADVLIRAVEEADLLDIARIHIASFKDRALSQLGVNTVRRYYAWLLTGFSLIHPICAVTQDGKMAGFCFSGLYSGSFSGFLSNNKSFLVKQILKRPCLVLNPIVREQAKLAIKTLKKLARHNRISKSNSMVAKQSQRSVLPDALGILSIAVDPAYQRLGIAGKMMESVEEWAVTNGFNGLHLSVHLDNLTAISFYEKLGFEKISYTKEWKGEMHKLFNEA